MLTLVALQVRPPPPPDPFAGTLLKPTEDIRQAILAGEISDILDGPAEERLRALVALVERERNRAFNDGQILGLGAGEG